MELKKLYYSISEVSNLTGVEQYTLRYWEGEFAQLKPAKNRAGNRIYTNQDIQLILKIKHLLKDKKFTFEGARKVLEEEELDETPKRKPKRKSLAQAMLSDDTAVPAKKTSKENYKTEKKFRTIEEDLLAIKDFLLFLRTKID